MESGEHLDDTISKIAEKLIKLFKNRWFSSLRKKSPDFSKSRPRIIINKLFVGYVSVKVIFIVVACLQIVIMKYFIGNVGFTFGWDILKSLINGDDWKKTDLFPRISGCDVTIRRNGQPIQYSFLCALPINMLNEKIYIFLWFWMLLCICFTFLSLLQWMYKLLSIKQKKRLICKLLIAERGEEGFQDDQAKIEIFINSFLRIDGVFIIEMITLKHGNVITSCLLDKIYDAFEGIYWKMFCGLTLALHLLCWSVLSIEGYESDTGKLKGLWYEMTHYSNVNKLWMVVTVSRNKSLDFLYIRESSSDIDEVQGLRYEITHLSEVLPIHFNFV